MKKTTRVSALAGLALGVLSGPAGAGCGDLEEVVGFTLVAATRVQGEFNGCEFDRLVEFENGLTLRCSQNRPKHAIHPKALVFFRQMSIEGATIAMVKACIDGDIYVMRKP